MSIEKCDLCQTVVCFKPLIMNGEPQVKIVREVKTYKHGLSLTPIEKCAKRCAILQTVEGLRA